MPSTLKEKNHEDRAGLTLQEPLLQIERSGGMVPLRGRSALIMGCTLSMERG
jgi:hypothetical protein